jgi:hypothetical protein
MMNSRRGRVAGGAERLAICSERVHEMAEMLVKLGSQNFIIKSINSNSLPASWAVHLTYSRIAGSLAEFWLRLAALISIGHSRPPSARLFDQTFAGCLPGGTRDCVVGDAIRHKTRM